MTRVGEEVDILEDDDNDVMEEEMKSQSENGTRKGLGVILKLRMSPVNILLRVSPGNSYVHLIEDHAEWALTQFFSQQKLCVLWKELDCHNEKR